VTRLVAVAALAAFGAAVARLASARDLADPPESSLRTNVSGRRVPAVLGRALVSGGVFALPVAAIAVTAGWLADPGHVRFAALVVLVTLGLAGAFDDARGDEPARGFKGHLSAGRLTGGIVKIVAGGIAGIAAAVLVHPDDIVPAVLTALAVPLAANLFNLLDRAPGRTGKAALAAGLPLLALGDQGWAVSAAGAFGALVAVLPADLSERGMLGDAGANPIGGLVGLGLAASLDAAPLGAAVALLVALNAASEVWSFSNVIERTRLLRALDAIGRK
jgi:UDP-GlcNAc:undecaprenyl-phosphate GlcNAc-1-phosphate transferase